MQPRAEMIHWAFGAMILFVGLCLLCEALVGQEVWRMRRWRAYLWPTLAFSLGVLLWPVMAFFTNSAIHMYAHGSWAEVLMLAGGAELALVRGRLTSPLWRLTWPLAFVTAGTAFIVHEQNPWFFARSAFLHHLLGWTFVVAAIFPLALVWRPRSSALRGGFARDGRRRLGDAPLRPRRRADLRAPVAARGGAAPMRTLVVAVLRRAARAGDGVGARDAPLDDAAVRDRALARAGARFALRFDQHVRLLPDSVRVLDRRGVELRATGAARRQIDRRAAPAPAARRRTPCAGMRSPPTRMSSPASGRSASASRRRP